MTEKIYLEYPYLRELEANIIEKKFLNDKYYIKLHKTIFYPHLSGGQPRDKGTINDSEVIDCYEDKNQDIVHVIKKNIRGRKVKLSIDWDNRLDHMQQHTGQHILSSVVDKLYNAQTIGFNIGNNHSTIDIELKEIAENDVLNIELLANKIIYSNFIIKKYFLDEDKIKTIPFRKEPFIKENIRIVEIDGIDYSACAGTHLRTTGEVGIIKIIKWEKSRGNIRIEFLAGFRALQDYQRKNNYINNLTGLLSSKDIDLVGKVEKLFENKIDLEKENTLLKDRLYALKAEGLLNKSQNYRGKKLIIEHFDNINIRDLRILSNHLKDTENLIQIYTIRNQKNFQFLIISSKDLNLELDKIYKSIAKKISIKGGGGSNSIQGSCKEEDAIDLVELFLKEIANV